MIPRDGLAKAARLLKISYALISSRRGLTTTELAARCGVCRRTVQRDLADLEQAGTPVALDCGRYTIVSTWHPPVWLAPEEEVVLFTAVRMLKHAKHENNPWIDSALEKLTTALRPGDGRDRHRYTAAIEIVTPGPLRERIRKDLQIPPAGVGEARQRSPLR